jgi:hypothetical protein
MAEKKTEGSEWWNKVSGLAGKILRPAGDAEPEPDEEPVLTADQRRAQALEAFRRLLVGNKGTAALALYHKTVHVCESWELPEKDLLQFAELLLTEKLWNAAVPMLENYLQRFQKRAVPVRLRLAKVLVEEQKRPAYAMRILADVPRQGLGEKEEKLRTTVEQKAQKLIDDGVLELEGRAW